MHLINQQLCDQIRLNLSRFKVRRIDSEGRKRAAVAVTVVDQRMKANIGAIPFQSNQSDEAAIILTIRASKLRRHAGQRAFPGGRIDPGESSEQAALRELDEEVGLVLEPDRVLGILDDYPTRSGYVITPVVLWSGMTSRLTAQPAEVKSIHRIPVSELLRDDAPILEPTEEGRHPVLKMPLGDDWFAAPTAAIAYQFREVAILGKDTRVAHFDEPQFAWG